MKTDIELKQLAMDIVDGKVFTDRQIQEHDKGLIRMIFMPITLGAFSKEDSDIDVNNIGLIYEYLDKAGPLGINSYPIFYSFSFLLKKDSETVFYYIKKYIKQKESFLK